MLDDVQEDAKEERRRLETIVATEPAILEREGEKRMTWECWR